MPIAITTPTGHVGRHLVSMLVRAGVRPTLLMRDPGSLDPAIHECVDSIAVDLDDGDAVVAATAGADALYWVCPSTMADDPVAAYARFGAVAARAVSANAIPKVVFQSSIGAEKRSGAGEIDGLARTEQMLNDSAAAVFHLRCGFFFSNLLLQLDEIRSGVISIVLPVDHPMAWVAPRDIAEVAALRLLSDDWTGHQVQAVHGPADLSWRQAAQIVSAAVGWEVRAQQIPDDSMRESLRGFGMGECQIEGIMGMSVGLRDDFVPEQSRTALSTTPTSLGAWCYDLLRPLLSDVRAVTSNREAGTDRAEIPIP